MRYKVTLVFFFALLVAGNLFAGGPKKAEFTNCGAIIVSNLAGLSDDGEGAYTNGAQCVVCRLDDPILRQGDFILDVNKRSCRTKLVRTASFNLDAPLDPNGPRFGTITTTPYFNIDGVTGVTGVSASYGSIVIGINGTHYSLRYGEPGYGGDFLRVERISDTRWRVSTSEGSDSAMLVGPDGLIIGLYRVPLDIVIDRQP